MYRWLIFAFVALFITACKDKSETENVVPRWTQEQSTELNSQFTREEEIRIRLYIKQREQSEFIETGSGLRYWMIEDVEGPTVQSNDVVDVKFKMSLLDGTVLYQTEDKEVSSFKVDRDDVESGLMEGISTCPKEIKLNLLYLARWLTDY